MSERAPTVDTQAPKVAAREMRFALVLNGGVSRALWMGGVTLELNTLRLASAGVTHATSEELDDDDVLKPWREILVQTTTQIMLLRSQR